MAYAYKCNWCKGYFDGTPEKALGIFDLCDMHYPHPNKRFHLCEDCEKVFLSIVEIKKKKGVKNGKEY